MMIIADSALYFNAIFGAIFYLINRIIHGCLEISNLFLATLVFRTGAISIVFEKSVILFFPR